MVDITRSLTVRVPLPTAVAYLRDWGHSPEWDPGTVTCTRIGGGPVEVGSEWRNVLNFNGREAPMVFRLERAEPDRLVFLGRNHVATSTDTITFATRDTDTTQITYHGHVLFHGLARLVLPRMRRELDRIGDELVGQLTAAVENRG